MSERDAGPDDLPRTWRFRLRFFLPRPQVFHFDEHTLEIELAPGLQAKLQTASGMPLRDDREWILLAGGFQSEDAALRAGRRAKAALLVLGAKLRIGFDVGRDRPTTSLSRYLQLELRERLQVRALSNVHGLMVYPEDLPVRFPTLSADLTVVRGDEARLGAMLAEMYAADLDLSPKETLALALYSGAHFEVSARAKFVLLISALESLFEAAPRAPAAQRLVNSWLDETQRAPGLTRSERDSLRDSLRWLFDESIGATGRKLVSALLPARTYGGQPAVAFFTFCYDVRSQLLHRGEPEDPDLSLETVAGHLDQLVADLLVARATRSSGV